MEEKPEPGENIKVVVRVRDLIAREKDQPKAFQVMDSTDVVQTSSKKNWTFDRVYSHREDNKAVYIDTAGDMIESTIAGFNATIFAYGQTSSGKTHTMYGAPPSRPGEEGEQGVIGMAVEQLFYAMEMTPNRKFLMLVSFIEIYNETVVDLLADPRSRPSGGLKIREDNGEVFVDNLVERGVTSEDDIFEAMREGERARKVGATNMNEKSSRSHTIFRIKIESTNRIDEEEMSVLEDEEGDGVQVMVSCLNLVDLAGSERAAQTGASGQRLKEGSNINTSLMTLGLVIRSLSSGEDNQVPPYRNSKLTRILKNSLGGNAKTAIICTVTPAQMSEDQTISTLRFASEAKKIQNHAKVNEVLDDQAQICRLKKEMEDLKKQLAKQKATNTNVDMLEEMREQLEKERAEKEAQLKLNEELRSKIITSSQPAPPRKSMINPNVNKKSRRETWCGPAMKRNMRMSMGAFLKPLPPQLDSFTAAGSFTPKSTFTKVNFEEHLKTQEEEKLVEVDEDDDVFEDNWLNAHSPSPVAKKKRKTVNFLQSPKFLSPNPRRSFFSSTMTDPNFLNCTDDGGTPKAVIRDKYKRVSMALSSREVELERERNARLEAETELQELQEFTRLEDEAGVTQDRKLSNGDVFVDDDMSEKLKYMEKSFKDAESLNLELKKELNEKRQESFIMNEKIHELEASLKHVTESEAALQSKLAQLEPLVPEVKNLREKTDLLERDKQDFDMKLELTVAKKDGAIENLQKCLESAYDEISILESGNKEAIKSRYKKMEDLQARNAALEAKAKEDEDALKEAASQKEELANLRDGFQTMVAELEVMSKAKEDLEEEVKAVKSNEDSGAMDALNKEVETLKATLAEKDSSLVNMELSNTSLLENIDQLSRNLEIVNQEHTNLLTSSKEIETFNIELKQEIGQLKEELKHVQSSKDSLESQNVENNAEIDELKSDIISKEKDFKEKEDEIVKLKHEIKDIQEIKLKIKDNEIEKLEAEIERSQSSREIRTKLEVQLKDKEIEIEKLREETERSQSSRDEALRGVLETRSNLEAQLSGKSAELTSLQEETSKLKESLEASFAEIQKLQAELLFANEEKKKLEESSFQDQGEGRKSMLEKLSATLTCIEESFVGVPDQESSITEDSSPNITISGTGITVEAVLEIKNQLLALQDQMVSFDPELKARDDKIAILIQEKEDLVKRLEETPVNDNSKLHEEYEDKMETMRKQHQAELAIITNKMKEDMKENLAALRDQLKEEAEVKEAEVSGSIFTDMSMDETVSNFTMNNLQASTTVGENLGQELQQAGSLSQELGLANQLESSGDASMNLTVTGNLASELASVEPPSYSQVELEETQAKLQAKEDELESLKMTLLNLETNLERISKEKLSLDIELSKATSLDSDNTALTKTIEGLKVDLEAVSSEKDLMQKKLFSKEEELQELVTKAMEIDVKDQVIASLEAKVQAFEGERHSHEEEVKALKKSKQELRADLELISQEKLSLQDDLSKATSLEADNTALSQAIEGLKLDLESAFSEKRIVEEKLDSKERELQELVSKLAENETNDQALAGLEAKLLNKEDDLEELKKTLADLQTKLDLLAQEKVSLQDALSKAEVDRTDMSKSIECLKLDLESVSSGKALMEEKLASKEGELLEFFSSRQAEAEIKDQTISSLEAELKSKKNDLESLKQNMEEMQVNLDLVSEEKKSLQDDFSKAIKLEVDNSTALTKSIEELKLELVSVSSEKALMEEKLASNERELQRLFSKVEEIDVKDQTIASMEAKVRILEGEKLSLEEMLSKSREDLSSEKSSLLERLQCKEDHVQDLVNQLEEAKTSVQALNEAKSTLQSSTEEKLKSLEEDVDHYKALMKEAEDQRDLVDAECDKLEAELKETKMKLSETVTAMKEAKPSDQELQKQVASLKEEIGRKTIEFASLKVDVERGELQYKKKCEILQADLDYEKSNNVRLTQEIRRNQSSAMDTTCYGLSSKQSSMAARQTSSSTTASSASASTNTSVLTNNSASSDSPVWAGGSGALKEFRLHDAEMKVKALEKDNAKLRDHEEFYINKAREWKNRALKYERTLQERGIPVPSRGDKAKTVVVTENNKENTAVDTSSNHHANSMSTSRQQIDTSSSVKETSVSAASGSPTIKLNLFNRQEPRMTEEDFKLPEGSRKKPDECKTQ